MKLEEAEKLLAFVKRLAPYITEVDDLNPRIEDMDEEDYAVVISYGEEELPKVQRAFDGLDIELGYGGVERGESGLIHESILKTYQRL